MKTYDVVCPLCGRINRNLYLKETDGWMECENCSQLIKYCADKGRLIPVLSIRDLKRQVICPHGPLNEEDLDFGA